MHDRVTNLDYESLQKDTVLVRKQGRSILRQSDYWHPQKDDFSKMNQDIASFSHMGLKVDYPNWYSSNCIVIFIYSLGNILFISEL